MGEHLFYAVVELAAGEQHPVTASETFDPDISAQAHNLPFVAAARMRLAQAQPVIDPQVGEHGKIISHVIIPAGG